MHLRARRFSPNLTDVPERRKLLIKIGQIPQRSFKSVAVDRRSFHKFDNDVLTATQGRLRRNKIDVFSNFPAGVLCIKLK